jgi:hypothetical protein
MVLQITPSERAALNLLAKEHRRANWPIDSGSANPRWMLN